MAQLPFGFSKNKLKPSTVDGNGESWVGYTNPSPIPASLFFFILNSSSYLDTKFTFIPIQPPVIKTLP